MDTPNNLNTKLQGSQSVSMQIQGPVKEIMGALKDVDGVENVKTVNSEGDGLWTYDIETLPGQDIRAELSSTVVKQNWGLVELTRSGMSLEDIFLQLTTEEEDA
jgi:ABC-2 type transport system ATP-binding protein